VFFAVSGPAPANLSACWTPAGLVKKLQTSPGLSDSRRSFRLPPARPQTRLCPEQTWRPIRVGNHARDLAERPAVSRGGSCRPEHYYSTSGSRICQHLRAQWRKIFSPDALCRKTGEALVRSAGRSSMRGFRSRRAEKRHHAKQQERRSIASAARGRRDSFHTRADKAQGGPPRAPDIGRL